MARRKTRAAQRAEAALVEFETQLSLLPDPRRAQGKRYPLETVVCTALMAMVCGADDAQAMEAWGKAHDGDLIDDKATAFAVTLQSLDHQPARWMCGSHVNPLHGSYPRAKASRQTNPLI